MCRSWRNNWPARRRGARNRLRRWRWSHVGNPLNWQCVCGPGEAGARGPAVAQWRPGGAPARPAGRSRVRPDTRTRSEWRKSVDFRLARDQMSAPMGANAIKLVHANKTDARRDRADCCWLSARELCAAIVRPLGASDEHPVGAGGRNCWPAIGLASRSPVFVCL